MSDEKVKYLDREVKVCDGSEDLVNFADFLFVFEVNWRVEIWDLLVCALDHEIILKSILESKTTGIVTWQV